MEITDAPVISLNEIPSVKKDFIEVNAQIEHEHLVNPAVYNPPELSHPDEYQTVIVDAIAMIEFEDEKPPFTLKGWLKYLNNNSHSITWIVDTGV